MSSALPFREVSDADAILNFIFDKNKSFIGAAPGVEGARPAAPGATPSASDPEWQDHLRGTEVETAAITAAEGGDLRSAQTLLDRLCADMPERASAFNNRAQLRRLQKDAAGSMTDLDTAIACGERWLTVHPEEAGSGCAVARAKLRAFHRQVLQQAYTQRAICHRCGVRACRERVSRVEAGRLAKKRSPRPSGPGRVARAAFLAATGGHKGLLVAACW